MLLFKPKRYLRFKKLPKKRKLQLMQNLLKLFQLWKEPQKLLTALKLNLSKNLRLLVPHQKPVLLLLKLCLFSSKEKRRTTPGQMPRR